MASFGTNNNIHHTVFIPDSVRIGSGNYIGPHVVLGENVSIDDNNRIEAHACIGLPGEKHGYLDFHGPVVIGCGNTIREFCTVQGGTTGTTRMGNNCLMLRGSHLSHDSVLEDRVTVSCNVLIGGESYIMEGANLGLGSIIHQRQIIGAYAMLGMGTVVPKKAVIYCGQIYVGNPAKFLRDNDIGLLRAKISPEKLQELDETFHHRRFGNYEPAE